MNHPSVIAAVVGGIAFVAGSVGLYFTHNHVEVAQDIPTADRARCASVERDFVDVVKNESQGVIKLYRSVLQDCQDDGYTLTRQRTIDLLRDIEARR